MMRKADSQLDFDLDLATKESQENPVYYVQYGHARMCSIIEQAVTKNGMNVDFSTADQGLLKEPEELKLLKTISQFPAMIEGAALDLAPHKVIFYLLDLAAQFHSYYNKHKVITDDLALSQARLCLIEALRQVFRNSLCMVGLSAPEKM
jgi:arginyl-tRNA synthetase